MTCSDLCPNCHHLKSQEERRRFRFTPEQKRRYMTNRHKVGDAT